MTIPIIMVRRELAYVQRKTWQRQHRKGDSAGTELRVPDYLGYLATQRVRRSLGCDASFLLKLLSSCIISEL